MEKNLFKKRPKAGGKSQTDSIRKEIRAGFYIRVSTEEQAENPDGSIRNQEERLKFALQMRSNDTLVWKQAGVYCDAGRSGKNMNRPELKRLIKDIEAGEINMIMVSELSRLTRSNKDFAELWEFLQANDCGFFSLRENFDTSTAAGEMMLYQIANFAQFERRQT
jgi:site-specific DNA recombinase